jgi:hypothetical protein
MTVTIRTTLSDEQRNSLLQSLGQDKIGIIYDVTAAYIVASALDSDALISALEELQVPYNIVNDEEVVHNFRNRLDFKLAGNLNLFPLTFTPGL